MDGCLLLVRTSIFGEFARTSGLFPPLPQGNQISIGRSRGRKFEFKLIRMCVRRRVAHLWVLREEAVIVVERVVVLSVLLLRVCACVAIEVGRAGCAIARGGG